MQVSTPTTTDPSIFAGAPRSVDNETVRTRLGDFQFQGGYPTEDAALRLADQLAYNRAIEAYLAQMPAVSQYHVWKGAAEAGSGVPNQLVIRQTWMNAETPQTMGNAEVIYALCALDLQRDGSTVVELPPGVGGGIYDQWQGKVVSLGPRTADRDVGGRFLLLPPDYAGTAPRTYVVAKSPTYRAVMGVSASLSSGGPDRAMALLKRVKVYPLAKAESPPAMTFVNGGGKAIDAIFPDTRQFFRDLAEIVEREPTVRISLAERLQLAAIGIEKGRLFEPAPDREALLDNAARLGAAIARAKSFAATDRSRLAYPDRRWEWAFSSARGTRPAQDCLGADRAAFAYVAFGLSPAMVEHVVGHSQYLWTPRDSNGAHLNGGKRYRLLLPPRIPARAFWSVVVYDAVSCCVLENGERLPTVSPFTNPEINSDGSVDLHFGPTAPSGHESNWIKTVSGRGWFPLLRLCGTPDSYLDTTWKPDDIVEVKYAHSAERRSRAANGA